MTESWGRYTPARKAAMIAEVYVENDSSALALATRLEKKFGVVVTRNAIIGTYGRQPELKLQYPLTGTRSGSNAGITDEQYREKAKADAERREKEREERRIKREAEALERQNKASEEPPVPPHVQHRRSIVEWETENAKRVTLLELTDRMCKWPINDGGPYLFCGCDKEPGKSYCGFHARLV